MKPFKRARQPKMTTQALLDFDLGESSSDSDFRIEDEQVSDDCSDTSKDNDDEDGADSEGSNSSEDSDDENRNQSNYDSDDSTQQLKQLLAEDMDTPPTNGYDDIEEKLKQLDSRTRHVPQLPMKPICCVCLGDRSDDSNEIIECDGCAVSVHEGCYGVSDNQSVSSTNSTCSTEPWFCEACRAGVTEPVCELCPTRGGIYKETDVGKWVHLVCALYVPGVAFGEVDQLSSVTLFEMQYSKWGAKACSLCEHSRFTRTGVCIGCDAGMCKTYFHVTCAQAAGFLTEAHHDEADAADPFYAHCKVHSEKEMVKKRKRNYQIYRMNMEQKERQKLETKSNEPCPAQMRIQRKLSKYQQKYASHKKLKAHPWVPTQKMSRLLTTSASAVKRLLAKADIMAVDVELLERQDAQIAAISDIRKKWHVPPAFNVEFVSYFLDRISRNKELKQQINIMMDSKEELSGHQDSLGRDYDCQLERNRELKAKYELLISNTTELHKQIATLCPSKNLANPVNIARAQQEPPKAITPPSRPISVPTAAALKMGVGFPLAHLGPPGSKVDSTRLLSTQAQPPQGTAVLAMANTCAPVAPAVGVQTFVCGICKRSTDQHLLAKCDTCKLHYHLGCLNPPLTRHPKKSKLYGWQCSECDKSDDSDNVAELPKGPRKSRTRFNKDGLIVPMDNTESEPEPGKTENKQSPVQKRRSMDAALGTKDANPKKVLNKSLPIADKPAPASLPATVPKTSPVMSVIVKKARILLNSNPLNSTHPPIRGRKPKCISNSTLPPPIHVKLPSDEPVLLEIPQATSGSDDVIDLTVDNDPLALPVKTAKTTMDTSTESTKQSRKQKRKDKHKNKHNLSSDTDKSPNKEHKRKRKKKMHDNDGENPKDGVPIPKIRIKFKTLPLPGEVTPEAQFFYVSADMVRSAAEGSRPSSVETIEEPALGAVEEPLVITKLQPSPPTKISPTKKVWPKRKSSPRKAAQRKNAFVAAKTYAAGGRATDTFTCCVCLQPGASANAVTCDECKKHYHFTCLEPPLKKSPKIRGYSWHCADCDPTDDERR